MKKTTLFLFGICCAFVSMQAQTTLFTENFNTGGTTFTLNSTDMSSAAAGNNFWIVNNSYTGGSGSLVCMAPIPFTVNNTDPQPAGITGSPNSGYLHILSADAQADGITNSCYRPSDGFCTFDENYFAKISTVSAFSTLGYNATLKFWWICGGSAGEGYGEVYFSTDLGLTWTLSSTTPAYLGQATWVQQTITDPAIDNKASVLIGFRFVNTLASAAADPAFSIDDIVVTGTPATGISSLSNETNISIMPNPASDKITVQASGDLVSGGMLVTVYDQLGRIVMTSTASTEKMEMDITNLEAGVYTIMLNANDKTGVTRFVKTK